MSWRLARAESVSSEAPATAPVPDALRSIASRFLNEYSGHLRTFETEYEVAPGFDNPEWHNGFEHDPEESARVRIQLLRELAAIGEAMVGDEHHPRSRCQCSPSVVSH